MATIEHQDDEATIRALVGGAVELMRARDFESISGAYTGDGILMLPGQPTATGREAVRRAWADYFPHPFESLEYGPTRIDVTGDQAVELGVYAVVYRTPSGPVSDEGKYVVIWRKEAEGWKIAIDILNSSVPAAA